MPTWSSTRGRGDVFDVTVGPRGVFFHYYDPNPHAGYDGGSEVPLAEFLRDESTHADIRERHGEATLAAIVSTARDYLVRRAEIDAVLARLPVDPRLRAFVDDPRLESGWKNFHAGNRLVSEGATFVVGDDVVMVGETSVALSVVTAVAMGGDLYTQKRGMIAVIDRHGTVVDPCQKRAPLDQELLQLAELHRCGDVVFVHYFWAESQGGVGYLRYERGRGFTARCDGPG